MMSADDALMWGGERLRLYHFRSGGSKLIVSFDFRQTERTGFNPPDPSKTFVEAGFDQLSLRVSRNDWFINPQTEVAESLMAEIASNYDAVQMIGYSMGGVWRVPLCQNSRCAFDFGDLASVFDPSQRCAI